MGKIGKFEHSIRIMLQSAGYLDPVENTYNLLAQMVERSYRLEKEVTRLSHLNGNLNKKLGSETYKAGALHRYARSQESAAASLVAYKNILEQNVGSSTESSAVEEVAGSQHNPCKWHVDQLGERLTAEMNRKPKKP